MTDGTGGSSREAAPDATDATDDTGFVSPARWTFVSMDDGRGEVSWTPTREMGNPVGNVHGGFVATVIDEVAAMAVMSLVGAGSVPTVSLHVDYLHGIPLGATYAARGQVVRLGRAIAVADAQIIGEDDRVLARGTCIYQLRRTTQT
jgi:uncharacterized protein (TIGR00369 family)